MIDILISWPQTLRVHNENINNLIILILHDKGFAPDPYSFSFGVSSRPNSKPVFRI